ncbi:cytochrome c maturation protein CcmE [Aquabacterium soli]|uniref:Cytochrome c-type biogenesis protein CcmE n=1 Tax=Aquabacterium soli TaxID=2493092 RepID=A0A3R8SC03_9BURK|nr:cytochrome c maturation protein CcmE [Aquabacterium soli]RRS06071.1 cytochrome c maturation protein CcmE [Aquabacterium soli]
MTSPRRKRLALVLLSLLGMGASAALVLSAFEKNLVFFFTPAQVLSGEAPAGQRLRVGGLVQAGSVQRHADGLSVSFVITDTVQQVPVRYKGLLPDLFKEGKGVVAQGRLGQDRVFMADEVLAKHDENYMPPEAGEALKQAANQRKDPKEATR